MGRFIEHTAGERIGKWTLVELVELVPHVGQKWLCRCDCGTLHAHFVTTLRCLIKKGKTAQCRPCGVAYRNTPPGDGTPSGARRSGLASMASKMGDREAFTHLDDSERGRGWSPIEELDERASCTVHPRSLLL